MFFLLGYTVSIFCVSAPFPRLFSRESKFLRPLHFGWVWWDFLITSPGPLTLHSSLHFEPLVTRVTACAICVLARISSERFLWFVILGRQNYKIYWQARTPENHAFLPGMHLLICSLREQIILVIKYWEWMTSRVNRGFLANEKRDNDHCVW